MTANKSFEYLKEDHYEIEDQELAKDLIESMTQLTLQDRPLPDEILIHPYFWEPMKKLELIIDIRKCLELKRSSQAKTLKDAIDLDVSVIKDRNLHPLHDAFVLKDIKRRSDDISKISNLLRYIRNKVYFGLAPDNY